ncbi:TGF-beta-activated kinase 1 and MAP3K7-binding protein 1-like isoform X2 [Rhopilema esculentum]
MENWVDDLPVCGKSGIGYQLNQRYRQGGARREFHKLEDRSFNLKHPDFNTGFYAVFDGHEGEFVAHYAAQKVPAELMFDIADLERLSSEAQVCEALRSAISSVERGFFEQIDEILVKRTNLQIQIPEGLSPLETCHRYPSLVHRLQELDAEIQGGTSVVMALVQNEDLYILNLGDSRALLCTKNAAGGYQVEQLSIDHNLKDDEELQRLANLGLDIVALQNIGDIVGLETTRSLGDFRVKGGYKEYDILKQATGEPVIAEPFIQGKIKIKDSFYFLVLFSRGLYKAVEEISGAEDVNTFIVSLVAYELTEQSTTEAAAQAVVDKICREHQDQFKRSNGTTCKEREDMTLLIRLFSATLRKKSTPITPPIHVSENGMLKNMGGKSPEVMHVTIPFTQSQEPKLPRFKPTLIMPNVKQRSPLAQSFSQPNSRVSTPVTLTKTAATPPIAFYRNLSHVSEDSQTASSINTPSTSSSTDLLGSATIESSSTAVSSSSSSRCISPWSSTVKADIDKPPTIDVGESLLEATSLLEISGKTVSDLLTQSLSEEEADEEQDSNNEPSQPPAKEEQKEPEPDDGKIDPYIDFTEFIDKINKAGGEKVVFAEFIR